MKTALYILLGAVGVFILVVIAHWPSPERQAQLEQARTIGDRCETMISDAAPGNERRNVRQLCENAKARALGQ